MFNKLNNNHYKKEIKNLHNKKWNNFSKKIIISLKKKNKKIFRYKMNKISKNCKQTSQTNQVINNNPIKINNNNNNKMLTSICLLKKRLNLTIRMFISNQNKNPLPLQRLQTNHQLDNNQPLIRHKYFNFILFLIYLFIYIFP